MRLTPYAQLAVALLAVVTARPAPGLLPRDIYDFSDEYSSDLADPNPVIDMSMVSTPAPEVNLWDYAPKADNPEEGPTIWYKCKKTCRMSVREAYFGWEPPDTPETRDKKLFCGECHSRDDKGTPWNKDATEWLDRHPNNTYVINWVQEWRAAHDTDKYNMPWHPTDYAGQYVSEWNDHGGDLVPEAFYHNHEKQSPGPGPGPYDE